MLRVVSRLRSLGGGSALAVWPDALVNAKGGWTMSDSEPSMADQQTRSLERPKKRWFGLLDFLRPRPPLLQRSIERIREFCEKWEERSSVPPGIGMLAGLCMETLVEFGQREAAWRIGRWLQARQLPDGSLSESRAPEPVFHATSAALRGWLAASPEIAQFEAPAQKAAQHLRSWISSEGRLIPPKSRPWNMETGVLFREPPDLTPLLQAGRRWPDTDWTTAALRGVDYWLSRTHRHFPPETSSALARRAHLLLEWERRPDVLPLAEKLDKLQLPSGGLPEREGQRLVLFATVAQAALVWFRLFNQDRGEAAYRFLERHVTPFGSLPISLGSGTDRDKEEDPLATKYFLDAALWRVRCAYRLQIRQQLPLDVEDPRLLRARRWAASFPEGALVADLGCGTGRYLRHLASWLPQLRWVGIDFVPEALEQIPKGIKTIHGSLLRIPVPGHTFHGALVVDTLSDCILPKQAIAEVLRVLRPGGSLLIMEQVTKGRLTSQNPWAQPISLHELESELQSACEVLTREEFSIPGGAFTKTSYLAVTAVKKRHP